MKIRVSADEGYSWGLVGGYEFRTGYDSDTCSGYWDAVDLGYPRIYGLSDGQVRVVYAWSDSDNDNYMTSTLLRITPSCD